MCVLIVKPAGANVPKKSVLTACTEANPHGFGIATSNDVIKTLDAQEFIDTASKLPNDVPAILHCRYATHGSIKKSNCHPFEGENWIFAHNGILHTIRPYKDLTDSETAFRQIFLPLLEANKGFNYNAKLVIEAFCGTANRFAFLNKTSGKITTFGSFTTIKGCQFSNTRWQTYYNRQTFNYFGYRNDDYYAKIFADTDLPF